VPIEPIQPIMKWFHFAPHDWFEESNQEEDYEIFNPFVGRNRFDALTCLGLKMPVQTLLDDYLHTLSLQFAIKDKELEQTSAELERKFTTLAAQWRNETAHISSITKQVMNFNYQRIIGMGPAVLPILFRELERKPNYWFWALEAITGENPTRPEDIGDIQKMAESWLDWARSRGYLNVSSARILLRQFAEQQV
jgi:hypothetical protein